MIDTRVKSPFTSGRQRFRRMMRSLSLLDVPTGTILAYSGVASQLVEIDKQWLYCDGAVVSRYTYRTLFSVIGTAYGSGDGTTTFNLPDLRQRFLYGSNNKNAASLGSGGSDSFTLTVGQLPSHDHNQGTLVNSPTGSHSHGVTDPGHDHTGSTGATMFGGTSGLVGLTGVGVNALGSHTHVISPGVTNIAIQPNLDHNHAISGSTGSTGLNKVIDKMPPYQIVHYIIRT
jgi:microcystin-dependent protein